ncbi:MAG: hypothetical protein WD341_06215 [Tistlia sp.]|uniref:hypothetical protein n=1 Tax=Tistlia sp. TaxID=3057121 RepID=UPI0034A2BBBE
MSAPAAALLRRIASRLPLAGAGCQVCGDSTFNHLQCAAAALDGAPCQTLAPVVAELRADDREAETTLAAIAQAAGRGVCSDAGAELPPRRLGPLASFLPRGGL